MRPEERPRTLGSACPPAAGAQRAGNARRRSRLLLFFPARAGKPRSRRLLSLIGLLICHRDRPVAALTWADIRRVVVDGGLAYGPQLRWSVQCDRAWLDSIKDSPPPFPGLPPAVVHRQLLADDDGSRERWWFLQWGPTTDNVLTHLFHDGDHLVITEEFCREDHLRRHPEHIEAVFVAEISRCSPP